MLNGISKALRVNGPRQQHYAAPTFKITVFRSVHRGSHSIRPPLMERAARRLDTTTKQSFRKVVTADVQPSNQRGLARSAGRLIDHLRKRHSFPAPYL